MLRPSLLSVKINFCLQTLNLYFQSFVSGSPAMLVSIDRIPAKREAEPTKPQLTAPMNAAVPMVAIAVCATVRIALTAAALNHLFVLLLI